MLYKHQGSWKLQDYYYIDVKVVYNNYLLLINFGFSFIFRHIKKKYCISVTAEFYASSAVWPFKFICITAYAEGNGIVNDQVFYSLGDLF